MSRTLTDFSQLSKGMFRKSEPVVEIKPIPIGLGTDPTIANKIKGLRGLGGLRGAKSGTRGREISKFLVENLAALLCRD